MPTYDYHCTACSHTFELFQSMSAPVQRKCPKCGKNALERLIGTGAAIVFKGSGFYQTDYRSEAYRKAAEADKPTESKPAETKADGGTDAKTGAKPEAKAETKPESKAKAPSEGSPAANSERGAGSARNTSPTSSSIATRVSAAKPTGGKTKAPAKATKATAKKRR